MIDQDRLKKKCQALSIPLTDSQAALLEQYARLLVEYNQFSFILCNHCKEPLRLL